jgi:hypothetical protein
LFVDLLRVARKFAGATSIAAVATTNSLRLILVNAVSEPTLVQW